MGTSIVRYSTVGSNDRPAWGVLDGSQIQRLNLDFNHHRQLMDLYFNDPDRFAAGVNSNPQSLDSVQLLCPLSPGTQLYAQGLNYADHRAESGLSTDAKDEENLIFIKASSSLSGPLDAIVRPKDCVLLDYEIELGIVLKQEINSTTLITDANIGDYLGGLVLCNDVSARDHMFGAPMLQWFKGKSYRTFCPAGPVLYLLDSGDIAQLYSLNLELKLNGEVKQRASTRQLIHKPPKTLTDISAIADLNVGDCVLTGTPGGVLAEHSLKAALAIVLNFKNDKKRRVKFVQAQQAMNRFLQPGDRLELSIKSEDGTIDLGTQHNEIVDAQ